LLVSVSLRRKTAFKEKRPLLVKTIAICRDVSGGIQTLRNRDSIGEFYGGRERRSSSEDNLSHESDSNVVNLYDSDVENSVVPVEQSGPRPYQFEPRRVRTKRSTRSQPRTI